MIQKKEQKIVNAIMGVADFIAKENGEKNKIEPEVPKMMLSKVVEALTGIKCLGIARGEDISNYKSSLVDYVDTLDVPITVLENPDLTTPTRDEPITLYSKYIVEAVAYDTDELTALSKADRMYFPTTASDTGMIVNVNMGNNKFKVTTIPTSTGGSFSILEESGL